MTRRLRKAAALAALLAGAAAGALLLLLDSDAVRQRIDRQVDALTAGQLRYESLVLRILPWPHVELRGISIKVPGAVEGTIAAAEIRPALLPLLAGRFSPSDVRLDRPSAQVLVSPAATGDVPSDYRRALGSAMSALVREAPGMQISAHEGSLEILSAGRRSFSLSALEGWAKVSADGIDAELSGAADLWQKAQVHARIEVARDGNSIAAALKGLQVGRLLRGATGTIRVPLERAATTFQFKLAQIDLAELNAAATALAGSESKAPGPLSFVPAGILRELSLEGAWPDGSPLIGFAVIRADARIEAASVVVPVAGIAVKNGSGRFVLAAGVLQGSELAGEIGGSSFSAGSLSLELLEGVRLRGLAATLRTDLTDAIAIARRLTEKRPLAGIATMEALEGRATGSIDYVAGRQPSPLKLELANIKASGRFRELPLPIEVSRGELVFATGSLRAQGFAGRVGRSQVRDANVELAFGAKTSIRSASGDAVLALGEIFPWLRARESLRPVLGDLENVTGSARVRLASLSGPAANPAALEFAGSVEPSQLTLHSPSLHAPWTLQAGAGEIRTRKLALKSVAIVAGDSRATVSGTIDDFAADSRQGDLAFSRGVLGRQGLEWLRSRWQWPEQAMPRAPVEIAAARLHWPHSARGPLAVQANVRIGGAVDVNFDVAWRPGELNVKNFTVKDDDSDVRSALHWEADAVNFDFAGRLDHRSFARMLAQPPAERGSASGEFRASMDLRESARSSASGTLQFAGVGFEIGGQRLEASGRLEGRQDSVRIEGEVRAKALDAEKLLDAALRMRESVAPDLQSLWNLPVTGRVAIAADTIAYDRHAPGQIAGAVEFASKRVSVEISEARVCGIDAPFSAVFTPAGIDAKARLKARGLELGRSLSCLAGDEQAVTGTFDLDADLAANGKVDALLGAAKGTFRFVARNGVIRQAKVVGRTLADEEVAARLRSDTRKLAAEGFPYREIRLAGSIEAGKARLDPGIVDSPSIGLTLRGDVGLADGALELQGLIAPIRRTAQGGIASSGRIVTVPIRIYGNLDDPQVKVLAAQAVGTTLLKIMAVQFLLPIQLLEISGAGAPPN